ncbi:MAG TPA: hypothetical protein PK341_15795 [Spirochaetota bacterium]|nr:hypothetical protein [Spirochaetota bacterium]
MSKFNNYVLKYLLFSFPAIMGVIIWGTFQSQQEILNSDNAFVYIISEILSLHLIFWFVMLIYILFVLLLSPAFRNKLLLKLARIKDRDEREGYIIGQSSRFTFFSTLAVLVFFLFFSTVNITINKLPEGRAVDGKKHELSIGLSYQVFDNDKIKLPENDILFSTQSLPFTKQNILILLIICHLGTFYYSSKKMKVEE